MYYVDGYILVEEFGFNVKKAFNGFVEDTPIKTILNGISCLVIDSVPVPESQISKVMECNATGVTMLDLASAFAPATRQPLKNAASVETPIYDEFVIWRKSFLLEVENEFKDAIKAKEMRKRERDEVLGVLNERLDFYCASIQVAEKAKDLTLARQSLRYATQMANRMFINALALTGKEKSVKNRTAAFKEIANAR